MLLENRREIAPEGMKRLSQNKNMTLKDKLPRSVGAQYATGEGQRNSSRRNEEAEQKRETAPGCGCFWW